MLEREFALDISRLIWRSWSARLATGIDRVCYAYLRNFADRSQAVVQHRGVQRILSPSDSDRLFELLLEDDSAFKKRLISFAPGALARGRARLACNGAYYINVGHTDIDLDRLSAWTKTSDLRPIYFIHDVIPLTHPEFCAPSSVTRHRGRVVNAVRTAAGIVTNSEASARDLREFATAEDIQPPPILAAWLAGAPLQAQASVTSQAQAHFVCVGTIEARKNHYLLLQIWRRLVDRMGEAAPKLIIVGQRGAQAGHVEAMLDRCEAIRDHVVCLSSCSDAELGRWVGAARALLMPSFAEGFGLPLVEALQLGTPVIASDLPCFREIGQGIPTLLDPLDAVSWEHAILSMSENGPERARQHILMNAYQPPTWDRHFADVEAWLGRMSRRRASSSTSARLPNTVQAVDSETKKRQLQVAHDSG
jgi:glycosyltransferase involved in cell wall biosynthesis